MEQLNHQLEIAKTELDIVYEILPVLEKLKSQAEGLIVWGQISHEFLKILDVCYGHRSFLENRIKSINRRAGKLRIQDL